MNAETDWKRFEEPFREPFARTLLRNITIAVVVGFMLALRRGNLVLAPSFALLVIWFSLGGHYVELFFLNGIRPRIARNRLGQIFVRIAVWFLGGALLYVPMSITYHFLSGEQAHFEYWWAGGLLLVGIEFLAHLFVLIRGKPNFYNGLG